MKQTMRSSFLWIITLLLAGTAVGQSKSVLRSEQFKHYIDTFNAQDDELYRQHIPNTHAWEFLALNIPLFECFDKELELTYYFRWWTYRKHLKKTPDGFVITEFLPPVGWAGKHNTINCAAGLHILEGRWLHDPTFLDDYSRFWFQKGGTIIGPRSYTNWLSHAILQRAYVTGDTTLAQELLDDMVECYYTWEKGWMRSDHKIGRRDIGLFYTIDDREGTEHSIGGHGFRPPINSAMYGEAKAIAAIARLAGQNSVAEIFEAKSESLKKLVQDKLWDPQKEFFVVLKEDDKTHADVREIFGYAPWCFNLPDPGYEQAWSQLTDPQGFAAPFGPTTAEQRDQHFTIAYEGHQCLWNGPSWPMTTSVTLIALANLLNDYQQDIITPRDYFDLLLTYARSHRRVAENGHILPWIDENLNPYTGDWISRTRLVTWPDGPWPKHKGGRERGKDYNHSAFCDLVISGLVGLRSSPDNTIVVHPLIPSKAWDFFCLDNVLYHGYVVTILYDRSGQRYGKGKGLHVLADGIEIAAAPSLEPVTGTLPKNH